MSKNGGMNITEFLEARIAEDEAYAEQAQGKHYGWVDYWRAETELGTKTESVIYAHAFRFSPQRVLAECAAKRAIIEEHEWRTVGHEIGCGLCNYRRDYGWEETGPCKTIRSLAAIYKDHPDYQQEWEV